MKKLILFLATLFGSLAANSQTAFGLRGGFDIANFSTYSTNNSVYAAGNIYYYAGAFIDWRFFRSFSIEPGLEYSVTGATVYNTSSVDLNTGKYTLQYVSLPIQLKYSVSPVFFAEAGLQFDYLLNAKVSEDNNSTISGTSGLNALNIAWRAGCGFQIVKHLGIDFHYVFGYTNILNNQGNIVMNNRVIQIGLFYGFKIQGRK